MGSLRIVVQTYSDVINTPCTLLNPWPCCRPRTTTVVTASSNGFTTRTPTGTVEIGWRGVKRTGFDRLRHKAVEGGGGGACLRPVVLEPDLLLLRSHEEAVGATTASRHVSPAAVKLQLPLGRPGTASISKRQQLSSRLAVRERCSENALLLSEHLTFSKTFRPRVQLPGVGTTTNLLPSSAEAQCCPLAPRWGSTKTLRR